jgi:biotin carboxyl carrier protein
MKKLRIYYNGKVHEIGVEEVEDGSMAPAAVVSQPVKSVPSVAEPPKTAPQQSSGGAGEPVEVPMPGRIVKLNVALGQAVSSGDTLMVLEAMKLENEVTCDVSGVVKELRVQVGDMVDAGDIVAVIG